MSPNFPKTINKETNKPTIGMKTTIKQLAGRKEGNGENNENNIYYPFS